MDKRVSLFMISISVCLLLTGIVMAEEKAGPSTIEVTGSGKVHVMPNIASISFAVETSAAKAEQAASDNAKRTAELIKVLRKTAGSEPKINTSGFALLPMYDKGERLRPTGYRVSNTVMLETKNLDKLGTLIDEASRTGVSRIGSLTFSTDEEERFRSEAAVKAVHQAEKIAAELARAAGLRIKKVIKLSYGPREHVRPYRMEAMTAAARAPIEIGELAVEEKVAIIFEAAQPE